MSLTCVEVLHGIRRDAAGPGPTRRVEALGGRIFLDSPYGAGTSLRAEFPINQADPPP